MFFPAPFLFFCALACGCAAFAQERVLRVPSAAGPVRIDGRLDEPAWVVAERVEGFTGHYPQDTAAAANATEVRLFRDPETLYIAAICRSPAPRRMVVQSLRRDFEAYDDESFGVVLNPSGEGGDGFWFAVNARGAQTDALLAGGGSGYSVQWDAPWSSAARIGDSAWIAEIAIPIRVLRGGGDKAWKANFFRNDTRANESSTWMRVPRDQIAASTAFTGALSFDRTPPPPKRSAQWNPYAAFTAGNTGGSDWHPEWKAGLDMRLPLTASLQLDATINPDFSHVDADEPVTDLSRFAQSVPEQRPFFLENTQMFSGFANGDAQPFFSRRIGLNESGPVPIAAGVKLSGELGGRWKMGLLDAHTLAVPADSLAAQNFFMASVQRGLFALSDVSAFVVNREGFEDGSPTGDYNRVAGANLNLRAEDATYGFKAHHHQSFSPVNGDRPFHQYAELWAQNDRRSVSLVADYVGRDYNPETGFAPRPGTLRLADENSLTFYPVLPYTHSLGAGLDLSLWLEDEAWAFSEGQVNPRVTLTFKDKGEAEAYHVLTRVRLTEPYDASEAGNAPLDAGLYTYGYWGALYSSSPLYPVGIYAHASHGGYYTGRKTSVDGELRLRAGPYARVKVYYAGHFIDLPAPSGGGVLHLTGGNFDLSLSTRSSFTTFVRHDPQEGATHVTLRFQYRYARLSDAYLVYGDVFSDRPEIRPARGLAARVNRWF